jgi:hypothetical protein
MASFLTHNIAPADLVFKTPHVAQISQFALSTPLKFTLLKSDFGNELTLVLILILLILLILCKIPPPLSSHQNPRPPFHLALRRAVCSNRRSKPEQGARG